MQASSRRIKGSRRGATWHGRDDELQHRPTVVSYNTLDPSHCKAARVDSALQIYQDCSFMPGSTEVA
ncbi:hypothetical protein E2562_021842 [Oryza meyeriana var. granulata]|uniref:Uncharacterized protein n=1 Tax=Oryza meyeriana var. granulata TaxID=110450 RepID=A0A6G1ENE7_9ORYZ|nr:hypothetical protein E2562_021842 [Oryza meyeriana var. granulata]